MKEAWENHWKDYYKILQIHPSAEPEVIKAAYNKLAQKYHPDKNKETTANEKMQDLNEAFEIISDPEKRIRYDNSYNQRPIRPIGASRGMSQSQPKPPTNPYKPQSDPQASPTKPSEFRLMVCPFCNESENMKILFVDKSPKYARCPKCHKLFPLTQIFPSSKVDEMSKAEAMRRMEDFLRKKKKGFW